MGGLEILLVSMEVFGSVCEHHREELVRIWSFGILGRFWESLRVLEGLRGFRRVRESFGMLGSAKESLGEIGSILESMGEFGKVLQNFGAHGRIWESFKA